MGFYSPSQLVQDARRHGVHVLPVDVQASAVEAGLETGAVRLGLQGIAGLSQAGAEAIVARRPAGGYTSLAALVACTGLGQHDLDALAAAGALKALAGHRRQAAWAAAGAAVQLDLLAGAAPCEALPALAAPSEAEDIVADYASLGLTLGRHPLRLLRERLAARRFVAARCLAERPDRAFVRLAGIVTCRQRPGTASGVVFVTLEDETGLANIVVYSRLADRQRRELLGARLLGVFGQIRREGEVAHLIAGRLVDLSAWLGSLETVSRDFH